MSEIWTEKYAVIRLTGRKMMVALASSIVDLMSFSTVCDSFNETKLNF
jgi:hypothetical protein